MLDHSEGERFLKSVAKTRVAGDVDGLVDLFTDDATFRIVGFGEPVRGREAIRAALQELVTHFEFLEWEQVICAVHGHEIAVRHRLKVKHTPNDRVVETETAEFLTMRDGLCASFVQFADTALIAELRAGGA